MRPLNTEGSVGLARPPVTSIPGRRLLLKPDLPTAVSPFVGPGGPGGQALSQGAQGPRWPI